MDKFRTPGHSESGPETSVLPSNPSVSPQAHQLFDQQFPKKRVVYSSRTGEVYCEKPFLAISEISYHNGKFAVTVGLSPELENGSEDWNAYARALGEKVQLVSGLNAALLQEGFTFSLEKISEFLVTFQKYISPDDLAQALSNLSGVLRGCTDHLQDASSPRQPNSSLLPSVLRGDESFEELESLLSLRQQAILDRFEYILTRRGYGPEESPFRVHSLVGNYVFYAPGSSQQKYQIYVGFSQAGDLEHLKKMLTGELESIPQLNLSIWDSSSGYSIHKESLSHREVFPGETPPTLADIEAFFSGPELDDKFTWALIKPKITGGSNLPAISQ